MAMLRNCRVVGAGISCPLEGGCGGGGVVAAEDSKCVRFVMLAMDGSLWWLF